MGFGQLLTAMITPFTVTGELDVAGIDNLVEHLVMTGTETIVVSGTTGESPTLTPPERLILIKRVKEVAGNRAKVMAGTGTNSTRDTIENCLAARDVGADGLMVVTPYYNKPPQESLFQHFKAVAESVDLPILVYNVPGRTACNLLPSTVCRISEIRGILGIKEASGNLDQVSEIAGKVRDDFIIYSGDDSLILPMMSVGARGVVSVASHIVGSELREMITKMAEGAVPQATMIHHRLFPLIKALFITTSPIPLKWALSIMGLSTGYLRPPLYPLSEAEQQLVQRALQDLGKI